MLPKKLRLKSEYYPTLAKRGKYVQGKYFNLAYILHDEPSTLFGMSISKKIDKRAVVRNRIKRKLRVAIRKVVKEGKVKSGKYLIIIKSEELGDKGVDVYEVLKKQLPN